MGLVRLDQLLSKSGAGSRQQVKKMIRAGSVTIDGERASSPETKVDPDHQEVRLAGRLISAPAFTYVMLHKPAGVVSADCDNLHKTVIDVIASLPEAGRLHPVGRLDIDTTGLMLLTDDGALAHRLLSPRSHVEKEYEALAERPVTDEDIRLFEEGMDIGDEKMTLPAKLRAGEAADAAQEDGPQGTKAYEAPGAALQAAKAYVILKEGRFHQVKRMFEKTGNHVLALKRIRMGSLILDPALGEGEFRYLTDDEVKALKAEGKAIKEETITQPGGEAFPEPDEVLRGADEE